MNKEAIRISASLGKKRHVTNVSEKMTQCELGDMVKPSKASLS